MSGPPPPLGQPWLANVGNNPSINRDPPPPPLGAPPPPPPAAAPGPQVVVEEQHHQPGISINAAPAVGLGLGVGVIPPVPVGINLPAFGPFGGIDGMGPPWMGGPLQPQRAPWNVPGLNGMPPYHAGLGVQFPPPPPGLSMMGGGGISAFAPTVPLWANGGAGVAGVGLGGAGMGMPTGMGMGFGGMGIRPPAPGFIDGHIGASAQPEQGDITTVPGGVPPGATQVEAPEHTIVHLLKCGSLPWEIPGQQFFVEILHFASTTGLNRVISVCATANGLDGNKCDGLAVTECLEMGNGLWEKGKTFVFDDAVSKVLTMKDAGWDNKRNRAGGQSLHLYLHKASMGVGLL